MQNVTQSCTVFRPKEVSWDDMRVREDITHTLIDLLVLYKIFDNVQKCVVKMIELVTDIVINTSFISDMKRC